LMANQNIQRLNKPQWLLEGFNNEKALNDFVPIDNGKIFNSSNYLLMKKDLKLNKTFEKKYKNLLDGQIEIANLDQADKVASRLNKIVAKDTNNKIVDFLNPDDLKQLQLLLLNTVYFKASWKHPFFISKTREQPFTNAKGEATMVQMMAEHLPVHYAAFKGWMMIELPFNQQGNTLALFLPPQDTPLQALSPEMYQLLDAQKKAQMAHIRLPKVKLLGEKIKINQVLPELMTWPLDQLLSKGKFENINILHQASVEWDEKGAEASAATATMVKRSLDGDDDPVAEFNRPFVYLIKDKQEVLFAGLVQDGSTAR
jgi:serine protease inhibitor